MHPNAAEGMQVNDARPVFWQHSLSLPQYSRGFHLISSALWEAMHNMPHIREGIMNLFIQHTSASLSISENTCAEVRDDLEDHFLRTVPDDLSLYRHHLEGIDDMPAHIKNVILGSSLNIPIQNSKLALGRWQGVYLAEHRINGGPRKIILTAQGLG